MVQAIGRLRLHYDHPGRVVGEKIGEIADHRARERAHARLYENVRRALHSGFPQLLGGLGGHGAIALHNPGGDFLIAVPCGVLNDNAARRFGGFLRRQAHAIVVIEFLDGYLRAFGPDVVKPALDGALGHVYHGFLMQPVGGPRHAAAMVAVRRGKKRGLAEIRAKLIAGKVGIIGLCNAAAGLRRDVARHGKRTAQHLKGVKAKSVGFVLDEKSGEAQLRRHTGQRAKRGLAVLGEAFMEITHPLHAFRGHDGKAPVVRLWHMVKLPLNGRHMFRSFACVCPSGGIVIEIIESRSCYVT